MALFLPEAAVGIHGSNNFHKHILPLGLESNSSDRDPQCSTLNTTDWDNHLHNSQPRAQVDAIPQIWLHSEAPGGLLWDPAVAGGSCPCLAFDGPSLHCAKSEG